MNFSLSQEDFTILLLALGYAAGAAMKHGDQEMARMFLGLTNTVNKDNPNFIPYEIPQERVSQQ